MTRRTLARLVVSALCLAGALASCAKNPVRLDRNRPPETFLVGAPAESSGASYKIHLYWRGEDADGYISGFLWSWDDSTIGHLRFTTKTDSIFELAVNDSASLFAGTGQQQPGQTKAHTFYIRAVDNLGKADPSFSIFSRRVYKATTDKPTVRFVGALPSGALIDTICDGQPFKICWTGSDVDGWVNYYRWDAGIISSELSKDTCAVFNDPNDPQASGHHLISGVYTFTVTAVDNAFARSDPAVGGRTLFVVNNDPDTRILPHPVVPDPRPVGYYRQPFENGSLADPTEHFFFEGDTIPFRSTVWWYWTGFDAACDNPRGITGYAAVLRGTHSPSGIGDPYTTGFQYHICDSTAGHPVYFTTNNPAVVGNVCTLQNLVLDSLDAGYNLLFNVSARDSSGRSDGTPAAFRFNCNFPPTVDSLTVESATVSTPGGGTAPAKRFKWQGKDREDGLTKGAQLRLDGTITSLFNNFEQEVVVPNSAFLQIATENPHYVELRVTDRAGFFSDTTLTVSFDIP
ncbi:MAG TPA: hypothetical protein VK123_09285 [Candidatus Limnocylindrales bacterium]|nr:hypothetical protein [Candidatus Limnocylindrales bacterium]